MAGVCLSTKDTNFRCEKLNLWEPITQLFTNYRMAETKQGGYANLIAYI